MNITFLIGNGFDLRLGLKTKFVDMYTDYIHKYSANEVVRNFKKVLQQSAPNEFETWGDFEMAMAKYAANFQSESDLILCIRDFKEHMGEHLKKEQDTFRKYVEENSGYIACAKEMGRSIDQFHKGQTPNVINTIETIGNMNLAHYEFITFNYTSLLDDILSYFLKYSELTDAKNLIHIHGHLDTDVVLGVDSIEQFGHLPYTLSKRGKRAFIKPSFNEEFDLSRVKAAEKAIEESDVICIYGMSLGQSDQTWIKKIYDWLIANPKHHLIYYKYLNHQFSALHRNEMMDIEDYQRTELLKKLCGGNETESLENQVHIPIGYDIFDFKNAIDRDAEDRRLRQFSTMGSMRSY